MNSRMKMKASLKVSISTSLILLKIMSALGLFPSFLVVFSKKSCVIAAVCITSAIMLFVIVQLGANFEKFLNKSFSKLAPNCTITNSMIADVIQTAAMTQDFLENTTKKLGNKPNADIIFKRIKEVDIETFKLAFIFILEFMIKQVKQKYNKREWTIAIDTHYEPFYGTSKGLWIHGYKPKGCKDCNGSYCYITIAIVIGQEQFTLMASPMMLGQNKADMVE